jgi:hypothetical protein
VLTASTIALITETVSTSETLVYFYETTLRNVPEGWHLHTSECPPISDVRTALCLLYWWWEVKSTKTAWSLVAWCSDQVLWKNS